MFESFPLAPPDSILGLAAAFEKDPRPGKINLTVGVFKDEQGRTPILESVRQAEERIFKTQKTKSYLPIEGAPEFTKSVSRLVLGEDFDHGHGDSGRGGDARNAHVAANRHVRQGRPGELDRRKDGHGYSMICRDAWVRPR